MTTDSVFQLIQSLTGNEKRFFKLFATVQREEKNYMRLFSAMEKIKTYDDKKLKHVLKGERFLKNLSFEKNYLQKAITEIKKRNLGVAGSRIMPIGNHPLDAVFFAIFNLWAEATQLFYPNASGCGIFCKKSLHEKIKGFDEKIKLSEDMDYVMRAGKVEKFRILKSTKVNVSMRRFEKEGRFKIGFKLLFSAIYRAIFGEIRSDVFKYDLRYRK